MTPPSLAEVAALRERLKVVAQQMNGHPGTKWWSNTAADLTSALALLDAQAADLARLTAERERARAALQDARAFVEAERECRVDNFTVGGNYETLDDADAAIVGEADDCLARIDQALAPAPAAEVA